MIRAFWRSVAVWPVTTIYLSAVISLILVVQTSATTTQAGVVLGFEAVIIIQVSTRHEITKVHTLVNSQHDELIKQRVQLFDRVDQLIATLADAGVPIPVDAYDSTRESGASP